MKITITNTQTITIEDNSNNSNNILDRIFADMPKEVKEELRKATVRNGFRRLIAQVMKNN